MWSIKTAFAQEPCPIGDDCELPNCIFFHPQSSRKPRFHDASKEFVDNYNRFRKSERTKIRAQRKVVKYGSDSESEVEYGKTQYDNFDVVMDDKGDLHIVDRPKSSSKASQTPAAVQSVESPEPVKQPTVTDDEAMKVDEPEAVVHNSDSATPAASADNVVQTPKQAIPTANVKPADSVSGDAVLIDKLRKTSVTPSVQSNRPDSAKPESAPVGGTQKLEQKKQSLQRPISPPPTKKPKLEQSASVPKPRISHIKRTNEQLNPRMLNQAPESHQKRRLILNRLHQVMSNLNESVKKHEDAQVRAFALAPEQLVSLALDEEETTAKESFSVYNNMIRTKINKLLKMTVDQWKYHLLETALKAELATLKPTQTPKPINTERVLDTGLTDAQERKIIPYMIARLHGLEQYGYVTSPPSPQDIQAAKAGVQLSQGHETCVRCASRFQVFPERRAGDGALTSGGACVHHPGRPIANGGYMGKSFTCCQTTMGVSAGCTKSQSHVFKVNDTARLASLLQFENTPDNSKVDNETAVSIDCEMAYTVYGFELIRLTVMSWPKGERVVDVLVRPFGAVLNLNSQYSGVTKEQFIEAKPYNPQAQDDGLQIVGSPKEARDLLFERINPSTPLIGHALENDMNALRVIHPCIVDTVLLCPHNAGLPARRSLKSLARDYLFRVIQDAGLAGHDSAEDAKAAGDVVRELVKRKWRTMVQNGWKFDGDNLVAPKIVRPKQAQHKENEKQMHAEAEGARQAEAHRMEQERRLKEQQMSKKRSLEDMEEGELELDY